MAYKTLSITLSDALLHVIYEHRYFTLAAAATERFGLATSDATFQREANELLPGIGVLIRDSLLIHARNLIEFYTRPRRQGAHPVTGEIIERDAREHDILLDDFQIPLPPNCKALRDFETPISVNLGHMTAWRDTDLRRRKATSQDGSGRQRPDWDRETNTLVGYVFDALEHAASSDTSWATPFEALRQACLAVRTNPHTKWPPEMTEKADVHDYLRQLGLH